jgi:putative ABC transport system permease protein
VSADYFSAMGMVLLRGRGIDAGDDKAQAPPVVVVDETLARRLYPGEDPIGKSLTLLGQNWEMVGITRSVRHFAIDRTPQAIVYGALSRSDGFASIVIRTGISPLSLKDTVRREALKLDPDQPIGNVRTLDYAIRQSLSSKRAITTLLGIFAVVATGLACVGIYGVTAHAVGQRERELSIRRALGARPSGIIRLVLQGAMKPSLAGIAAGLAGAAALVRLVQSQLFEVTAFDPAIFLLATGLLLVVAAVSIYAPARRAAAADPMKALRE